MLLIELRSYKIRVRARLESNPSISLPVSLSVSIFLFRNISREQQMVPPIQAAEPTRANNRMALIAYLTPAIKLTVGIPKVIISFQTPIPQRATIIQML